MIILGSRDREKILATGQFHCPTCGMPRPYRHVRVDRYFALYFIPLFKFSTLAEYVQCQVCHSTYDPAALHDRLPAPSKSLPGGSQPPAVAAPVTYCADCGTPNPSGNKFCWTCGQPLISRH